MFGERNVLGLNVKSTGLKETMNRNYEVCMCDLFLVLRLWWVIVHRSAWHYSPTLNSSLWQPIWSSSISCV